MVKYEGLAMRHPLRVSFCCTICSGLCASQPAGRLFRRSAGIVRCCLNGKHNANVALNFPQGLAIDLPEITKRRSNYGMLQIVEQKQPCNRNEMNCIGAVRMV
jgi:phage tail protein X